jgi:hypothetical protein
MSFAAVVEWQTRMLEGHVAQAVKVQVLSAAPDFCKKFVTFFLQMGE